MKKQSEGLAREYDRLLNEHQELQVMLSGKPSGRMTRRVICYLNIQANYC